MATSSVQVVGVESLLARLERMWAKAKGDDGTVIIVGYQTRYAIKVHERTDVKHDVGQAKFLEQPAVELRDEIANLIANAADGGMELDRAMIIGGLHLQRASQLLVPVDTGTLKNSAFTRKEKG